MPCIRRSSIQKKHLQLGDLTMNCESFPEFTALPRYLTKWGIWHLLKSNRKKEAKNQLLYIPFMAATCEAFGSPYLQPLLFWRAIGFEMAYHGYKLSIKELDQSDHDSPTTVGSFMLAAGNYACAEILIGHALKRKTSILGKEHPSTLVLINNMAIIQSEKGKKDEALKLYRKSLELKESTLGYENQSTLATMANLGAHLSKMGSLKEAKEILEKASDYHCKIL